MVITLLLLLIRSNVLPPSPITMFGLLSPGIGVGGDGSFSKGEKIRHDLSSQEAACVSAKWGPAASKSPGFSGERKEPPPFWSNETCQPFQLGSACSFPFSNIHKHNERQQRLDLKQMSCALDLEPVFPSRARHWLGHQVGFPPPPILWILLDSEGSWRRRVGVGGHRGGGVG